MIHVISNSLNTYNQYKYYDFKNKFFEQPQKNYTTFNEEKVDKFVKQGEHALPYLNQIILNSKNEEQITETLYILNKMLDNNIKGVYNMYYALSKLNNTKSPSIQTFLAGLYRKMQVPDAFGPLIAMLIRNSINLGCTSIFDPNEEIGGAILSYISDRFRQ